MKKSQCQVNSEIEVGARRKLADIHDLLLGFIFIAPFCTASMTFYLLSYSFTSLPSSPVLVIAIGASMLISPFLELVLVIGLCVAYRKENIFVRKGCKKMLDLEFSFCLYTIIYGVIFWIGMNRIHSGFATHPTDILGGFFDFLTLLILALVIFVAAASLFVVKIIVLRQGQSFAKRGQLPNYPFSMKIYS
jgi:uncharacterized Tic20 family protein